MEHTVLDYITQHRPDLSNIPGGVDVKPPFGLTESWVSKPTMAYSEGDITLIRDVMRPTDCQRLIEYFESIGTYAPVTIQGTQVVSDDTVGSMRITGYAPTVADDLYQLLADVLTDTKVCNEMTPTDWWQYDTGRVWEVAGFSPMLRFMRYSNGGKHYPHYDAGYIYPNTSYRTLKSFILYLTTNKSGATRFIRDGQDGIPVMHRNHADWDREPLEEEVISRTLPVAGNMLVFDHRLCHDVEAYTDEVGDRVIIRGDVLYRAL
jgi:hypothetical protein